MNGICSCGPIRLQIQSFQLAHPYWLDLIKQLNYSWLFNKRYWWILIDHYHHKNHKGGTRLELLTTPNTWYNHCKLSSYLIVGLSIKNSTGTGVRHHHGISAAQAFKARSRVAFTPVSAYERLRHLTLGRQDLSKTSSDQNRQKYVKFRVSTLLMTLRDVIF